MKGYVVDLEKITVENKNFRQVLYTAKNTQLVLMSLDPGQDIGSEVHTLDQFFRIDAGTGQAVLDGTTHEISDGWAVLVPAGMEHNIINTGSEPLRLYTLYSPPEHQDGIVQATKAQAMAQEEHFDGKTTE